MLTERILRLALHCAATELKARLGEPRAARPPMAWNSELIRALELELAVSSTRQPDGDEPSSSEHDDWITSRAAAELLGWNIRTVQRRHADLDGRKIGRQYVFPASAVHEQAELLTDDRGIA